VQTAYSVTGHYSSTSYDALNGLDALFFSQNLKWCEPVGRAPETPIAGKWHSAASFQIRSFQVPTPARGCCPLIYLLPSSRLGTPPGRIIVSQLLHFRDAVSWAEQTSDHDQHDS